MSDRLKLASIHARDWSDTDWRCPWLRINTLLRDFAGLYRIRSVRTILRPRRSGIRWRSERSSGARTGGTEDARLAPWRCHSLSVQRPSVE